MNWTRDGAVAGADNALFAQHIEHASAKKKKKKKTG